MYTAVKEGTNYAVYYNGNRISTTSESGLANFGLSPTKLSSTQATTAIGTQVTQQAKTTAAPAPTTTSASTTSTSAPANTGGTGSGGLVAIKKGPADLVQTYQMPGVDLGPYNGKDVVVNGRVYRVSGNVLEEGQQGYPSWLVAQMPQFDANGKLVGGPAPATPTATTTGTTVPNVPDPNYETALAQLLNSPGLTADQKTALKGYFDVVASNDQAKASKMISAFQAGVAYSSPIFKAQVLMVEDALKEGLSGVSGDLAYNEQRLRKNKEKLEADLSASNEYLDFTGKQELENLKKSYDKDLEINTENMAATGKTSSSVRTKSEEYLKNNFDGLTESKSRQLAFTKSKNARDVAFDVTQTDAQIKALQDAAIQKRIALLRDAESKLGTKGLADLGFSGGELLGTASTPINSELERDQYKDAFSFAGNFF